MTQDARSVSTRTDAASPQRFALWRDVGAGLLAALGFLGCATLGGDRGQPLVPSKYETRTGPFAIFTNAPIAPDAPAVRNLQALERDLRSGLGLQAAADGPPVEIYILNDRQAFTHFLTFYYPELPPRRAFFLAQGPRRVVYTFHNDRLDEDLRHEATHALLHSEVGDLPLWLDEGLAEYFEGPEGRQGYNPEHVARLPDDLKSGWRPDLARLETLANVRDMSPRDYRESWAWVHFLLNDGRGRGKAALLAYLADVRKEPKTLPLSERLAGVETGSGPRSDERMLSHLDRVRTSPVPSPAPVAPVAAVPVAADPTVLLQDSSIEPGSTPRSAHRRSLFGRFLALFGGSSRSD
jgi:hypothetical protein